MRNVAYIGVILLLISAGYYISNSKPPKPSPAPIPVTTITPAYGSETTYDPQINYKPEIIDDTSYTYPTQEPIDLPSVPPVNYTIISPGESAQVQCGDGNDGVKVTFQQGTFAGNIGLGGQADINAAVTGDKGQPAGGLLEWSLHYRGKLQIDGCNATFIAPDSIGTAYSTSAEIYAHVERDNAAGSSSSNSGGEGGPRLIGGSGYAKTKVTIMSGAKPGCYDPAGVAISVNSVNTTDSVRIEVDTPKFPGRVFNGRNATVRDGAGTYHIQIFVNGSLYDSTSSEVSTCQLPAIKR